MFVIRKILSSFLEIPGLFIFITIFLLIIFRKKINKFSKIFILGICLMLYIFSTDFVARNFILSLEDWAQNHNYNNVIDESQINNPYIIVLSSGYRKNVYDFLTDTANNIPEKITLKRTYEGFRIHRKYEAPIIVSGGIISEGDIPLGLIMKEILMNLGMKEELIIVEDRSKTTEENAKYSLQAVGEDSNTIFLVTSAVHMKRSYDIFKKYIEKNNMKLNIIPVPCDYSINKGEYTIHSFLPSSYVLDSFSSYLHELFGSIIYSLK